MKTILPILALLFFAIFPGNVFAASLELSKNSDFSQTTINFSAGETIHARVVTNNAGEGQKVLNIRDNQYNFLSSVALAKSGNTFSASFSAPSSEGYYSLEAKITSNGSVVNSVKTIKVGSPNGANVKVHVNSKVQGESVSSNQQDSSNEDKQSFSANTSDELQESPQISPSPGGESWAELESDKNGNFLGSIFNFCRKALDKIWPF